jgi:hypothetical protein
MLSRVAFAFGFLKHEYAVYSGLFFSQLRCCSKDQKTKSCVDKVSFTVFVSHG